MSCIAQTLGEGPRCLRSRYQRIRDEREANIHAQEHDHVHQVPQPAVKSIIADSEFLDSGLGISLPAPTSYAETMISFMTSISGGKRIQIPLLPEEAKIGLKFECMACGKQVKITNNSEWR